MPRPNAHFLVRLWREGKSIEHEIEFHHMFEPTLVLELKEDLRPLEDWWQESMEENLYHNISSFLPPGLEVCAEPIWFEAIGRYSAHGWRDYWGEYDEDFDFELISWSVAIEEKEMVELIKQTSLDG